MSLALETADVVLDDGCRIHHRVWGDGPPLVVLHGGPGGSGRYWYDGIPALGERFRVHAPDLRGHGLSSRRPPYTLRQMGEDILEYIEKLGLRDVTLLGHSMGSPVALEAVLAAAGAAEQHDGQRIGRIVLLAGFASTRHLVVNEHRFLTRLRVLGLIARLGLPRVFRRQAIDRALMIRVLHGATPLLDTRDGAETVTHTEEVLARSVTPPLDVVWRIQPDLASYDLRDRLGGVRVPVLALVGEHDALARPVQDELVLGIPDCERMVLPDCGHNPFLENPAAFLDAVTGWVPEASQGRDTSARGTASSTPAPRGR